MTPKAVYEDQLASVRKSRDQSLRRANRFFAAHGWTAGRARTGNHHRRCLSIFLHSAPQVHHCRYSRSRAVHAKHGHRRLDGGSRDRAGGCDQGRVAADPAATHTSRRLLGNSAMCSRSTRWIWSIIRQKYSIACSSEFSGLAQKLNSKMFTWYPISALEGDNVVRRSPRTPWFHGPALLQYLEELPSNASAARGPVRFPVQYVIRPDQSFRGFAGQLESGTISVGDEVVALPSGIQTRVKSIVTFDGMLEEARAGEAVTLTLENEVDLSRGDLLVGASQQIPDWPPLRIESGMDARRSTRSSQALFIEAHHSYDSRACDRHPSSRGYQYARRTRRAHTAAK